MDAEQLAAIRERADAATSGEWVATPNDQILAWLEPPYDVPGHHRIAAALYTPDAEFIAHARTDVPALLDEIDRMQAAIDRVWKHATEAIDEGWCDECGQCNACRTINAIIGEDT